MANQDVINYFKRNRSWKTTMLNVGDSMFFNDRNFEILRKRDFRTNFNIDEDEELIYCRDTSFWDSSDQGCVITDWGVYVIVDNEDKDSFFCFSWKDIDHVTFKDEVMFFWGSKNNDTNNCSHIHQSYFSKNIVSVWDYQSLAKHFSAVAQLVSPDIDPIEAANEGRFDVAIAEAESQLAARPESVLCLFNMGRVIYLEQCKTEEVSKDRLGQAINFFRKAIDLAEDRDSLKVLNNNIAFCYELSANNFGARYAYISALEYASDLEDRNNIMKEIRGQEEQLKDTWNHFTEIFDYPERKFCMPVRDGDIGGCVVSDVDVFMISNLPSQYKFPVGHPYPNQLYIGHPYKKGLYVPYEESEDMFFMDKVHELCYLLECLGAESIEITSIKGKNVSEMTSTANHLSGSADFGILSGEGEISNSTKNSNDSSQRTSRNYTIKLDPMRAPYLPDGLVWYNEQPQWQRLVERRLNNNILDYTENIQSSETKFTAGSEMNEIKAQVEYLWNKVGGTATQNVDTQFKSSVDTVWTIKVRFRSMKDFNTQNTFSRVSKDSSLNFSSEEQEYLDEYRLCITDGTISDSERRLLNRLASTLGLSDEQVKKIESTLNPQLLAEEKEYLEEYRLCREEGEITPSSRRLLDRIAKSLNLTPDQIHKLETL